LLTALAVTLKPEQALWVSGYLAGLSFERSPPAAPSAPRSEPRTRDAALTGTAAREITILYGSETGNSAALALALGDAALSLGLSAAVVDMANYDPRREEEFGAASRRQWRRASPAFPCEGGSSSAAMQPPAGSMAKMVAHALESIYDNATSGSVELAESYRLKWAGDREQSIGDLIPAHTRYAALVGFLTGFGGILSTPVAAPLNLSSVIVIQVRMIAAIARLRGYALTDPKAKMLVFISLAGSGAAALVQELGFSLGKRISARVLAHGTRITARKFNATLGRQFGRTSARRAPQPVHRSRRRND